MAVRLNFMLLLLILFLKQFYIVYVSVLQFYVYVLLCYIYVCVGSG